MTYDQILVFHKIIEHGSFKAAAQSLHRTQPALSFAIKKLEEELAVELFDRSVYRPALTLHGKSFYEHSQKIMQGMDELEDLAKSFHDNVEPEITIAVDGISPLPYLLKTFREIQSSHTNTKLNLSLEILSATEKRVVEKEAQIGVTHFIQSPELLEIIPISSVRLVPVISSSLYQELGITSQRDLLTIDQIVVTDSSGIRGPSFGILENGRKWRIGDSKFKNDIIRSGLGWGHIPEHEVIHDIKAGTLKILDFEDIFPRELDINIIRLKRYPLGKVGKVIWERLKALREV